MRVVALRTVAAAPGASSLAFAREEVEIDNAKQLAVIVRAFEYLCVGMWLGHIAQGTEMNAVQAVGYVEHTAQHVVQFQVRTYLILVDVEAGLLGFFEVIAPVPALRLELLAVLLDFGLDVCQLLFGLGQGRCPQLVEQVVNILFVLGHTVFEGHGGIIGESHQFRLLQPRGHQVAYYLLVVGIVAVVAPVGIGLEDAFTQFPVVGILQERHDAGVLQGEDPFAFHPVRLRGFSGTCDQRGGQSGKVGLIVNDQFESVGLLQHILSEGQLQHGYLAVQFPQLLLVGFAQVRAVTGKALVRVLQQLAVLGVEVQLLALVIDGLHTGEQTSVQRDVIAVGGELGGHLLAQCLQLSTGIGAVQSSEYQLYTTQQSAALVKCHDGILEGGCRGVVDDGVNFFFLFFHSLQHSFAVILNGDFLKGRYTVRGFVLREEGVDTCRCRLGEQDRGGTECRCHE